MAYRTIENLPADIRDRLPLEAQELYRAAYNSALDWYGDVAQASEVAWRAVRNQATSLNSSMSQDLKSLVAESYSVDAAYDQDRQQILSASKFS